MNVIELLKKDKNIRRLFSSLPDLSSYAKTYRYRCEQIEEMKDLSKKSTENPLILTAYHIWFGAYLQKQNKKNDNHEDIKSFYKGVQVAIEQNYINKDDAVALLENIKITWEIRENYIENKQTNTNRLLKACLFLAQCKQTGSNKIMPEKGYFSLRKDELETLQIMTDNTEKTPRLFQSDNGFWLNPIRTVQSEVVETSYTDYVMGNMLSTILIEPSKKNTTETIDYLLANYFITLFDDEFPCAIQQIGIYNPFLLRLVYFDIETIDRIINIEIFSSLFLEILKGDTRRFEKMNYSDIKLKVVK